MTTRLENNGNSEKLYSLGLPNHCRWWLHEIKRWLLLGRKARTNLDSIFKSRDITLATKVHLVKRKKKENEVTQLYPTLCDPMDSSPSGSSIHGIFQARILGWIASSFSRDNRAACFKVGLLDFLWESSGMAFENDESGSILILLKQNLALTQESEG